ncbi:hypothetical protein [Iningainema tapete]|uniref:Uncharacterized protein n=1 Tax=Iningainema tapete BLCC-T55 TaxID=2748662 RepID=A0A8J7C725_9CYAN|nr:hypothetical protein [Iningainema tapete]MBD2772666.1 hypothetical protein [Iningainema tapete BLCC-T55]
MKIQKQNVKQLDYSQENASNAFVPNPPTFSSFGCWENIHFEHHQQPAFEVAEHQHTWHTIAYGHLGGSLGERWLDGKIETETRHQGDIAIIPAGISHRCNWDTSAQFTILAIDPVREHVTL